MLGDMYPNRSQDQKHKNKRLVDSLPDLIYANKEEEIEFELWTNQYRISKLLDLFDLPRGSLFDHYDYIPISRVFGFLLEEMRKEKRTGKKMDYDVVRQKVRQVKEELLQILMGECD